MVIPTITGRWYTYSSEKYDLVSWDDELPNMMGKIKFMPQTANQISMFVCVAL
jgi:hypothetical protein